MLKRLLLLTLCGVLMLGTACSDEQGNDSQPTHPSTNDEFSIVYAPNETVNRFLKTLKERSKLEIQGATQGNNPNEYITTLNGCQVSMTPSAQGMGVMILGDRGASGQKQLIGAFTHVVNAADKSCTKEQLDAAIAFLKEQTSGSPSFRVCNEVKILSYLPSVKVGGSETQHRLDLVLLNYVEVKTEE